MPTPDDSAATCNAEGQALLRVGRIREALQSFHAAIEASPESVEAWRNWSDAQFSLARFDDAIYGYQETIRLNPNVAEVHFQLGLALRRVQELEKSIASFHQALRLRPGYAEAHTSLANSLLDLGLFDEADGPCRAAVRFKPDLPEAHNTLGRFLSERCKIQEALASFERALALRGDYPDARLNRGILRLLAGDFEEGWPDYEERLRRTGAQVSRFRQPAWDGAPLEGKTILIYADQGCGDTLQFIRYVPLVQANGGRVIVEAQDVLADLLTGLPGVAQVVSRGAWLPSFDVQAPLVSLPGIFHTRLDTIPRQIPYLRASNEAVENWRRQLQPGGGCRVGIAWQGHSSKYGDRRHLITLANFARLAQVEGVRLISLQVKEGLEQINGVSFDLCNAGDASMAA